MSFYVITQNISSSRLSQVELAHSALKGGATVIQLREKEASSEVLLKTARELKELTARFDVPLIINDHVQIALEIDAAGVHVGDEDISVKEARTLLGEKKIIGASCTDVRSALVAWDAGADYLGVGPIYQTGTKRCKVAPIGPSGLFEIKKRVGVPIIAIGGINESNLKEVLLSGADGVAVISAISEAPDVDMAVARIAKLIKEFKEDKNNES